MRKLVPVDLLRRAVDIAAFPTGTRGDRERQFRDPLPRLAAPAGAAA